MKRTIIAVFAMQCVMLAAAHAAPAYDRSLEEAAKRMVAERIGDVAAILRGTFDAGQKPEYSTPQPRPNLYPAHAPRETWDRGFVPAAMVYEARHVSVDRVVLTGSVVPQD